MLANLDYWQSIYSESNVPKFPSQFSVFVQSWLCATDQHIIEVGCGNGRDACFFHQLGHNVTVSDQVICDDLIGYAEANSNFNTVESSIQHAADKLNEVVDFSKPVVLYSRFFQHAISEADQQIQLRTLSKVLHKDSLMFFEFRLDADERAPKEFGTTHFRRFQSSADFKKALMSNNFHCFYSVEGVGHARYKSEDPYVGRFVCKPAAGSHLRAVSDQDAA